VREGLIQKLAMGFALFVHVAFLGGAFVTGRCEVEKKGTKASLGEQELQHIEAGLAVKSKSTKGRKTKQPQKDVARKISPNDVVVSKDDKAKPEDKDKPKEEKPKPEDEIDPEAIFKKHREGAEGTPTPDPAVAENGGDEESKEGQADGSEFGRLEKAKGDPYVGELVGRMTVNPELEVPSTVPEGSGLVTYGCLKLSPDGKIANVQLDPDSKSGNSAFNSAVLRRLKQTTDMEQPVPENLRDMLVEKWACVPYRY
jgi:hypothetical protein